ncbi:MAG: FGGY family carbohydrate kinase [Candidatus Bathyarchaeia archaeon]|jgi:glycerol kinase
MQDNVYLAVIDAGTIGERTIIFDTKGNVVAEKYLEHPSYFPEIAWVEQDASEWWNCVCKTAKAALKEADEKGIKKDMIVGISVTSQRETIVPVAADATSLRKAIVWQDRRTVPQCDWIDKNIGPNVVYETTGLTIDPYFSAPKIRWIMEKEPSIYKKAYRFLLVHDYLIAKFTDAFITSWDNASRTMLFDIRKFNWSEPLLTSLRIDREKMPDAHPTGEQVGEVSAKAAAETGFAKGTPVFCGGGDQQCSAVGAGVIRQGRIVITTGTGTFLLAHSETPVFDPKRRILCSCHAVPGKWVLEASVFSTGSIYRWFRDQFGSLEKIAADKVGIDPYEILNSEAAASSVGSRGIIFLPHFVGAGAPYWNPQARGIIFGLTLGHTRHDLIRSILEGVSFEIRKNMEVMEELGIPMKDTRVTGGMTRGQIFNQIQADIYGLPVLRETRESTALGCALLAGVGAGIFKSIDEAVLATTRPAEKYRPVKENQKKYESLFQYHKRIYEILDKSNIYQAFSKQTF